MRIDLHVHTRFSVDSLTTMRDVLYWAERHDMDALAITDHNTIAGARLLARQSSMLIIVGEEIRTDRGEIIGLFLEEAITPDQPPMETVRQIHAQGGVVYLPHPLDRVRHSAMAREALGGVLGEVDVIEVLNARVTVSADNRLARELAQRHDLAQGAGSDAHQGHEIGRAYVEMPSFGDASQFLTSLRDGCIRGRLSSPLVHVGSTYARVAKGLRSLAASRSSSRRHPSTR